MNLKIKLTLIIIALSFYAKAQPEVERNLKKYWYYRDRLEKEYMIIGMPEKQGTNWPLSGKYEYGFKTIGGGENPTQEFGTYLCVLASEYRLLKDYSQNTKASETLQKIAWALESFDRVDLNCEKFFRARIATPSLLDTSSNFWEEIDNYRLDSDLNGCFLRGDVEGSYDFSKCDSNKVSYVPNLSPDANILTFKDNQLASEDCREILEVKSTFHCNVVNAVNKTVMSQDEVWGLFMGLAFIVKFVDDSKTFLDLEGNNVTVKKWAKNITARIIRFMQKKHDRDSYVGETQVYKNIVWTMAVPVDDTHNYTIHHGGAVYYSYLFAKAANEICKNDDNYENFQDNRSLNRLSTRISDLLLNPIVMYYQLIDHLPYNYEEDLHLILDYWGIENDEFKGKPYGPMNLSLISGTKEFYYYYGLYKSCSNFYANISFERLPVVYSLLHDKKMKSLLLPSVYKQYKNDYLNLLSQATDCGPWRIEKNGNYLRSNDYWFYNRWEDNPNPLLANNEMPENDGFTAQKNGLDYMVLHNLYWLGFLDKSIGDYEESVVINHDYPWWWYGTDKNPMLKTGKTITSNKVVKSNGNLTLIASESITLNDGFDAKDGAFFEAYIKPTYRYVSYDPDCPCFFDRPEFDKNYVSKDTVITKEKNSRIIAENNIKEKNEAISSLENDKLTKKVIIRPNPFNNQLFIYSKGNLQKNTSVQIYNNLGVLVFEKYNTNYFETVNTSNFARGLYVAKIKMNNKIFTYKIIKQ